MTSNHIKELFSKVVSAASLFLELFIETVLCIYQTVASILELVLEIL